MLPAAPKRAARETPPRLRAAKVFPWIWPTPRVPPDQRLMWLAPCGPTRRPEIERLAWKFAPEKVRALRDIPGAEKCMAPPPKRAPPPPKRAPPPLKCPPPPPKWPPPPPKWPPPPPKWPPPAAALNGSASAMIPATARVLIFDMTKPRVPLCCPRAQAACRRATLSNHIGHRRHEIVTDQNLSGGTADVLWCWRPRWAGAARHVIAARLKVQNETGRLIEPAGRSAPFGAAQIERRDLTGRRNADGCSRPRGHTHRPADGGPSSRPGSRPELHRRSHRARSRRPAHSPDRHRPAGERCWRSQRRQPQQEQ